MTPYYEAPQVPGDSPKPGKKSPIVSTLLKILTYVGLIVVLIGLLLPFCRTAGGAARRSHCTNNLRQIALGLKQYESEYHAFPPAYTVDASGKPLHSWRTLILPYLEQASLYHSINLSKPWDDPANAEACKTPIPVYLCPNQTGGFNHTSYLAVVSPGSCLLPDRPRPLSEITDTPSKTLMVIEAVPGRSVPWMCPRDADASQLLSIDPRTVLNHASGFNGLFADGHIAFLHDRESAASRRALISVAGNDDSDFNH